MLFSIDYKMRDIDINPSIEFEIVEKLIEEFHQRKLLPNSRITKSNVKKLYYSDVKFSDCEKEVLHAVMKLWKCFK